MPSGRSATSGHALLLHALGFFQIAIATHLLLLLADASWHSCHIV
jgi:hypothetical protein